jgi:hypothetical protein
MLRRASLVILAVLVAGPLLVACGGGGGGGTRVRELTVPGLTNGLLDLKVEAETSKVKALGGVKRPFIDRVGLFSLRRDALLEATLQVSRFTKKADVGSVRFRNSVINQIGSTIPHEFRMGDNRVFLTAGRRQSVAVWFRGRYLFILSTRDEYPQPRALLRTALDIKP